MGLPVRLGISLPVSPLVQDTLDWAVWAEQKGWDAIWFADTGGQDPLTVAAAVAMATKRIRLGMAVVPAYTRTPAVFASTLTTLAQLAPGRLVMGLGASSHAMMEGWHGIPFRKPLTRVKETASLLRNMLTGERHDFSGETLRSSGFRLNPPVSGALPIYLAALRSKMLEMAGEVGDGVVLNTFPVEALPRMMDHIRIGAERAGKKVEEMEIVNRHHAIVTDDVEMGRRHFRQHFTGYFATPVYNKFLAWMGYEEEAEMIDKGWKTKNRDMTAAALSDALVDKICVIGPAEHCREQVREYVKHGITTPVINPIGRDPKLVEATFNAFSPEHFFL